MALPPPDTERGLRQLVAASADAMILADAAGRVVLANHAAARLYGRPREELEQAALGELLPPLGQDDGVVMRDGRAIPVEMTRTQIDGIEGPLFCIALRDISARRLAERRDAALLRLSRGALPGLPAEELFAMVTQEAATLLSAETSLIGRFDDDGVVVVGVHGKHSTPVGSRIPGDSGAVLARVARSGSIERVLSDGPPQDEPTDSLAGGRVANHAVGVPVRVHTRRWGALMVASTAPIPREAGRALTRFADVVGTVIAASEARAQDAALRESEERFRQLADFVPHLVWTCNADGSCDFLNHRWEDYTGAPAEQQLGDRWMAQVHPDDRPALAEEWTAAVAARSRFAAEFRLRGRDGAYRRFDTRAEPLFDASGELVKWFGSNTDVEDERRAAQAIRDSETQLREALAAGRMGAFTLDLVGGRLHLDRESRTILAIPDEVSDEAAIELARERVDPRDRAVLDAARNRVLNSDTLEYHAEYRIVSPDSGRRWVVTRASVTRDAEGRPLALKGVISDATAERQAGERDLRSQKLEALGTLAGGIAHDFNNMLQVVSGNVGLVLADMEPDDPARRALADVERAARRSAELVQRILAFARPGGEPHTAPLDLAGTVAESLELLRPGIPAMIELRADLPDGLPAVTGDPVGVSQVITNLLTNAAQAIGRRAGTISLALDQVSVGPDDALEAHDLAAGAYLLLTVADDGPGMDAATVNRVFDPFFTTKALGEGTGLGLSIVHTVMRAHRGAVLLSSIPGAGTTFRLYFPVAAETPAAAAVPPPASRTSARAGRILVVDDEPDLVALQEKMLGRLGHEVSAYTDPRTALEAFRADPEGFDALVTDLSMPGMTGIELARAVLMHRPGLPVLIASGHMPSDEHAEAMALGVRGVLPKPSPIAALRDALDAALG